MSTTPPSVIIATGNIIQAVHYDLSLEYPDVLGTFERYAGRLLGTIPKTGLIITRPLHDPRGHKVEVAGKKDHEKRVVRITKITIWQDTAARAAYLEHPNLISWCEWILNGWRLVGSAKETLEERRHEFIEAVLSGSSAPSEWALDLEVSDSERPWLGEALSISSVSCVAAP